jgi:RHS repeat-associated protein
MKRALMLTTALALVLACAASSPGLSPTLDSFAMRAAAHAQSHLLASTSSDPLVPTDTSNGLAVGSTVGGGDVSFDGAARYRVPLWLPPGRAGIQPDLALTYNNRDGNGLLGVGWSLSGLPRITRCARTFAQDGGARAVGFVDGDQGDRFCLDGQRLVAVDGPNGAASAYGADGTEYRLEHDQQMKIVSYGSDALGPTYFKVYLKDGRILTLGGGGSPNSWLQGKRAHVGLSGTVTSNGPILKWQVNYDQEVRYGWALSRMEDRAGNYLAARYSLAILPGLGYEQLPESIAYTASAHESLASATRRIEFSYEDRPDRSVKYASGLRFEQRKRLARVDMRWLPDAGSSRLLRSYRLHYRHDSLSKRSLLDQVQECDGADACLSATRFDWSPYNQYYNDLDTHIPVDLTGGLAGLHVGDLDADGRDDILYRDDYSGGARPGNCNLPAPSGSIGCGGLPGSACGRPGKTPEGRLIDVNGDSRADLILLERIPCETGKPDTYINRIYLNLPDGSRPLLHDTLEEPLPYPKESYALDMNGDGLPEFVHPDFSTFRPNTDGRPGDFVLIGLPPIFNEGFRGLAIDIDGSGRASLLLPPCAAALLPCGGGSDALTLDAGRPVVKPTTVPQELPGYSRPIYMDVNGDGLADWVSEGLTRGFLNVSINTGNGFTAPEHWSIPAPYDSSPSVDPLYENPNPATGPLGGKTTDVGARVIDYNGDGRQDLLLMGGASHPTEPRNTVAVLLSTGTGFQGMPLPGYVFPASSYPYPGRGSLYENPGWKMSEVLDANGDGLEDFIQVVNGTFHVYLRGTCTAGAAPTCEKGDLLTGITNGLGVKETFEYRPVNDHSVYTPGAGCTYPQTCATRGVWVVFRHQISAPSTPTRSSLRYEYQDGRSDLTGRGWLGFGRRSETDEVTGRVTSVTFDNQTRRAGFYPCLGIPRLETTDVPLDSGIVRRSTASTTCQVVTGNGDRTYFAYPASRELRESEGTSPNGLTLLSRSHASETQDSYGNVTTVETLTYPIRNGEPAGRAHRFQTTATFDNFDASWLIGQKTREQQTSTTRDGRSGTRTTEYDYDPDTGLLTATRVEPEDRNQPGNTGSDFYLETSLTRDQYGLVSAIARTGSGQTRGETVEYDTVDHMFPQAVTDAAGNTARFASHHGLGVLTSATDANGPQTSYQYDGFGRERVVDRPDDADVTTHYLADAGGLPKTTISVNGGLSTDVYLDRYGREVARAWQGFSGNAVRSETTYDEAGRTESVTYPHAEGASPALESFRYDALNRLLTVINPDGTSRTAAYVGLQTTERDEKGNQRIVAVDELGRLASDTEMLDGHIIRTSFDYGPFNQLEMVTAPDGSRTSMTYDKLGRRAALTDPDAGASVTHYNAFGEVKDETDASSNRTIYDRDVLGRPRTVRTRDGVTTFTWDTAPHGIGMLAASQSPDGVQTKYRYDPLARVAEVSSTVAGSSYALGFTYDAFSRLNLLTYPAVPGRARLQAKYTYTARGDLQNVQDPGTHRVYWAAQERNALRQPTADVFGDGITTTRQYDSRARLRFVDSKAPGSAQPLQALEYQYEDNGNLASRYDRAQHVTENFTYDSLDRLTGWDLARARVKKVATTYAYTDGGNILSQTVEGNPSASIAYTYGEHGAGPHAVTTTTSGNHKATYTYDAIGNDRTGPGRIVDYTSFGLPSSIKTPAGKTTLFRYDAIRIRSLKQQVNGNSIVYIQGFYEKRMVAGKATHVFYVMGDSGPVAQVMWSKTSAGFAPARTLYLHNDALGSIETVSDANAHVVAHYEYSPFGARRTSPDIASPSGQAPADTRLGFTGHEHDDEFGLINMRGRMYDPALGRFLSPDPLISQPGSGQAYNRYSYVSNRPTTLTDPTGFWDCPCGPEHPGSEPSDPGDETSKPPPPPPPPPSDPEPGTSCPGTCGGGSDSASSGSMPHVADDNGSRRLSPGNSGQVPEVARAAPRAGGAPFTGNAGGAPFTGNAQASSQAAPLLPGGGVSDEQHGQFWWWLHSFNLGLVMTKHDRAEVLRKSYGPYVVDNETGDPIYLNGLSDDKVIALFSHPPEPPPPAHPLAQAAIGIFENAAGHIFRDAPGHLREDTPANRTVLEGTANSPKNYLGQDQYGNDWYAETRPDGSQVWARVRNGQITNGGVNATPGTWDPQRGLVP